MAESIYEQRPKFFTLDTKSKSPAVLRVVGVGGGGCNAIQSMIQRGLDGVEFIAINTDAQSLRNNSADCKIQVGANITDGMGAGADPKLGRKACEEDRDKIAEVLAGANMVFLTTGLGGGTGTGGIPVVASIAKSQGALVVAIVTKPFSFEGKTKMANAEEGIRELKQFVDSLIVIPNDRLLAFDGDINIMSGFDKPNDVLYEATRGISDIINLEGKINVDFADVRNVMTQSGEALIGVGAANGENRAIQAAQNAIHSPLLEGVNIQGAQKVLINVVGSNDLTLAEITAGNEVIAKAAGGEATIIFGIVEDPNMKDSVSYTVIATGFGEKKKPTAPPQADATAARPAIEVGTGYVLNNDSSNASANLQKKKKEIIELRGGGNTTAQKETTYSTGFTFNTIKADKPIKNDEYEEEDSSSFLKMIMD